MRAIEYIENFKKSISNYDVLKRIIEELMPLRLDRDATEKYYNKYLINDIFYEHHLFNLKEWELEGSEHKSRPEFVEENSFISHNDVYKIREDLLKVIINDKSFGYLFYFLASELNRKDVTNNIIICVPNDKTINDAVKGYRDLYSSYNLMDYLEDDINYEFYTESNRNNTISDEEWINIFSEAYNLFDIIRVNLNTPDKALKIIINYVHPDEEVKRMIVSFLCDLFQDYEFDLDDKAQRKFEIFSDKILNYYVKTYISAENSTITKLSNDVDINDINWQERTSNFDCDTIEKVVKSYDGPILQLQILNEIQIQYKKEKAKNSFSWDIADVNQFCNILKKELKSEKIALIAIDAAKDKAIIKSQKSIIEEQKNMVLLMETELVKHKEENKEKKPYTDIRNGYTINSYINSNDLNLRAIFLAIITFFQEKEYDTLDFFTDLNQHFTKSFIPQEIYNKYPSTKEEGKIFIFCLLLMIDKKKSNFLILKKLKVYFDNELRINFTNEVNCHRKDLNLPLIDIPNLQKEGLIQNTPNKSIEIEMFNVITAELKLHKELLEKARDNEAKLHDINRSLMEKIKEYEENNIKDNKKEREKDVEPITKSMTTFQQVLVFYYLFDHLGVNFSNSDKSQWINFIHKFTGKNEQNIKEKLYIDFDTKETKKNLRLIAPLFSALFSKIEEKIKKDSQE